MIEETGKNTTSPGRGRIRVGHGGQRDERGSRSRPYSIQLAVTEQDLREAFGLVHAEYVAQGYDTPNVTGMRVNLWNALPGTYTVVAKDRHDKVIGTVSYVADSSAGLPSDELSKKDLDDLRRQGRRLFEVSGLAIASRTSNRALVMAMFQYGLKLVQDIEGTDYIITVNPHHQLFYKKFLCFEQLSSEKRYSKACDAPGVCMRLNLETLETVYFDKYSAKKGALNLHDFFFRDRAEEIRSNIAACLPARVRLLDLSFLLRFFADETQVLQGSGPLQHFLCQWANIGETEWRQKVVPRGVSTDAEDVHEDVLLDPCFGLIPVLAVRAMR